MNVFSSWQTQFEAWCLKSVCRQEINTWRKTYNVFIFKSLLTTTVRSKSVNIFRINRRSNTKDKMSRNFTFNILRPFLSEGIVRCVVCLFVGPSVLPSRPVYHSKPIISNDSCSYLIQQLTQWARPPVDNVACMCIFYNPAALWNIMNILPDYCLGPALVRASPPHNIQCIFLMLEPILIVGHLFSFSRSF